MTGTYAVDGIQLPCATIPARPGCQSILVHANNLCERVRMSRAVIEQICRRLRDVRLAGGITADAVNVALKLGPGWVERFEAANPPPTIEAVLAMAHVLGCDINTIFADLDFGPSAGIPREFIGEQDNNNIDLRFPYGKFDAVHTLTNATIEQLDQVLTVLRNGLAGAGDTAGQSNAVASAFLHAVRLWPKANPSNLWYFLIYRAYLDPYNHPAANARLDFGQSWKRTGGWALERVAVSHYNAELTKHGIRIVILDSARKAALVKSLAIKDRVEADKIDVVLLGTDAGHEHVFGVVNVKASFAERRTDDVPMSQVLINNGYFSPLWTFDCKATPSAIPVNKGELGVARSQHVDSRSAKRKDIEVEGFFSGCFSYNTNTIQTPAKQDAVERVVVCDFSDPNDHFSLACQAAWAKRKATLPSG